MQIIDDANKKCGCVQHVTALPYLSHLPSQIHKQTKLSHANNITMDGPPPPYEAGTFSGAASSSAAGPSAAAGNQGASTTQNAKTEATSQHKTRNGIPPQSRRSMEDEARPLPPGWVRQYDHTSHHQYFVDTTAKPPRSIWQHPYDDPTYMSSLSEEDRAKIQGLHRVPSHADVVAESSDDDHDHDHNTAHLPRRTTSPPPDGLSRFGRKMKDAITGTTHEERKALRAQREEEERQIYERHQKYRMAMARAMETGEPQFIGKDKNGRDVYIEPPARPQYGAGGYGFPAYNNGYGYNPYGPQGPYHYDPNARYLRPADPYYRPYYGGYGGGLGVPLGLGLGGGLLAGSLLSGKFDAVSLLSERYGADFCVGGMMF